jgi:hypothetical protein
MPDHSSSSSDNQRTPNETFGIRAPQIALPTGGVVRGIGEKLSANPVTGISHGLRPVTLLVLRLRCRWRGRLSRSLNGFLKGGRRRVLHRLDQAGERCRAAGPPLLFRLIAISGGAGPRALPLNIGDAAKWRKFSR